MIAKELLIELHHFLFWFKPKHKKNELSLAEIMILTVLYKEQCQSNNHILPSKLSDELGYPDQHSLLFSINLKNEVVLNVSWMNEIVDKSSFN